MKEGNKAATSPHHVLVVICLLRYNNNVHAEYCTLYIRSSPVINAVEKALLTVNTLSQVLSIAVSAIFDATGCVRSQKSRHFRSRVGLESLIIDS